MDKLDEIFDHIDSRVCGNPFCDHPILTEEEAKTALKQLISEAEIKARLAELQLLAQVVGPARDKETWEDWAWRTHKALVDRIDALKQGKGK